MNNTVFLKLNLIFCFFTLTANAQTYLNVEEDNEGRINALQAADKSVNISEETVRLLGIDTNSSPSSASLNGNEVFIKQVGELNALQIRANTNASNINVVQDGYQNDTKLNYEVNTAMVNILQEGNKNIIKDVIYDASANVSLDITQQGNGFYFERFGSNSITNSITLKQTEAAPALIIRSFE